MQAEPRIVCAMPNPVRWTTAGPRPIALASPDVRSYRNGRIPLLLWPLAAYLGALLVFGKGPTYLGFAPLFWGEGVLLLAVIWLMRRHVEWAFGTTGMAALSLAVAGFIVLGAGVSLSSLRKWDLMY